MASTVADVAGIPAEQAPDETFSMTSRQWRLAVVAELVLGGILGSLFLGTHGLFLDESVSATLATAPWHRFTDVVTHREANMVLYYLLLRGWVVFGHSEIALRSLSVILAVGALWVVIMLARTLFGRRAALSRRAAPRRQSLLRPVRPRRPRLRPGAPARQRLLLLLRPGHPQVDPPPRLCWTAYTIVTALAAYSNFWAALVPVGQALSLAFLPPGRIPWRRVVASAVALVVLLLPSVCSFSPPTAPAWIGPRAPRPVDCSPTSGPPSPMPCSTSRASPPPSRSSSSWCSPGAGPMGRLFARQWPLFFTACWLVVPVAAVVMLSLVDRPLLVVRYLMVSLPPRSCWWPWRSTGWHPSPGAAPGGGRRAPRHCRRLSAVGVAQWYSKGGPQDFRPAVTYLADRVEPGDGVLVFAPYERMPVEWYMADRPAAERPRTPSTRRRPGA